MSYKLSTINYQLKLFDEAKKFIPGGVNSPIRSKSPIFAKKAKGSKIDGLVDFCMSYGALILGHAHPEVVSAVKKAVEKGTSFGVPTELETKLAKFIVESIPSIELVRLTNSGAEATIGAVKLARAYTKRDKIIKFKECYHGFILDAYVGEIDEQTAAVIVEPVGANNGVVIWEDGFLEGLRKKCDKFGALLIFDEVVTGFRVGLSGAQGIFGIKPDLTCLGKVIGGGLPVGAFGGRRDIMELLAPIGPVYHAGTFCGNPVSVTAGLTTLKILKRDNPYKKLEEKTKNLGDVSFGSMFSFKMKNFKEFYNHILREGIYLAPSVLETNFVSIAHTDRDIRRLHEAINKWKD